MSSVQFDTHKIVRLLRERGFDEQQAEGITEAIRASSAEAELATKRDINDLKLEILARFERIDGDIRLNRWILTFIVGIGLTILYKVF